MKEWKRFLIEAEMSAIFLIGFYIFKKASIQVVSNEILEQWQMSQREWELK